MTIAKVGDGDKRDPWLWQGRRMGRSDRWHFGSADLRIKDPTPKWPLMAQDGPKVAP